MTGNEKIIVLGGGESGTGAAILAKTKGIDVFVSDQKSIKEKYRKELINYDIPFEEGRHSDNIFSATEIIKSPGIPEKSELIKKIRERNIPIISEIEFAGRYTDAKIVGITGSNGKTTTTLLTYHIFSKAGLKVGLAGNIGESFARQVATKTFDYYVLELSSFQLDDMFDFRCDVGILLNITPDHLDRYEYDISKYAESKFRIAQNMTSEQYFIYCADDEITTKKLKEKDLKANLVSYSIEKKLNTGAWLEDNEIKLQLNNNKHFNMSIFQLALQGKHNIYNSMAASVAARIFDIRKEILRESLSDFRNAEHRLEFVNTIHGIDFINDSKATNVNSVWYALESMTKPVIWIVGGVDKGNDYLMLQKLVEKKVKAIICLGVDNEKIHTSFGNLVPIEDAISAEDAVQKAYKIGKMGDVVLLSPACASFDLFENYEDRGRQFKQAVKNL